MNEDSTPSLREAMIRGTAIKVMARWLIRALGAVNVIIIARLLTPEDFGLVAMATVLYGGLQVIFSLSIDAVLIRNIEADKNDFNTAWTVGIIQSFFLSAFLFLISHQVSIFYEDYRIENIIHLICLSVIIRSFTNVGLVYFRKNLEFSKEVIFGLVSKLLSILATITLAFFIRSYWALVYGMIASAIINVVLSYAMHSYRPKFCLTKFKELWSFSAWMIFLNTGMFLAQQGDRYIVGSQLPADEMGLYTTSAELAELPTTELLFPLTTTLFPGFAKIQDDSERLRSAFIQVIGFVCGTMVPVGLGLSLISTEFITLLLGKHWENAIPLLQTLALFAVCRAVYALPRNLLVILKKEKIVAAMAWINATLFLLLSYLMLTNFNIMAMIIGKIMLAIIFAWANIYIIMRIIKINRLDISQNILRPCIAGLVMIVSVNFIFENASFGLLWDLLLKSLAGAIIYTTTLLCLWAIMGKPFGFEKFMIELVSKYINKVRI